VFHWSPEDAYEGKAYINLTSKIAAFKKKETGRRCYYAKVYINIVGGLRWKVPLWKTNRWITE
jgi:hypothetical protein